MTSCRNTTTHHAYSADTHAPCCGVEYMVIAEAHEVVTTDAGRVTCGVTQ